MRIYYMKSDTPLPQHDNLDKSFSLLILCMRQLRTSHPPESDYVQSNRHCQGPNKRHMVSESFCLVHCLVICSYLNYLSLKKSFRICQQSNQSTFPFPVLFDHRIS
jgi:hypothetical protein